MILVDSSVWIEHFSHADSKGAKSLHQLLLANDDISIIPVILTEVLMGFKDERAFQAARTLLMRVPKLPVTPKTHVQAAVLFRKLQKAGVTVRGAIDCIIAQACIESRANLLTLDRDFTHIAKYSSLRLFPFAGE